MVDDVDHVAVRGANEEPAYAQGSVVNGWTISKPRRCASSYAVSTSSPMWTEMTEPTDDVASRVTSWTTARPSGVCRLATHPRVEGLDPETEEVRVELPRLGEIRDREVGDDARRPHRVTPLAERCYCRSVGLVMVRTAAGVGDAEAVAGPEAEVGREGASREPPSRAAQTGHREDPGDRQSQTAQLSATR